MASGTTEDLRRPHRPLFSALTYAAASYGLHFLGFELGLVFVMGSNRRPGLGADQAQTSPTCTPHFWDRAVVSASRFAGEA
jgi:hypothetical protein